jgi:predicted alpha/beta-hydrolase family hydrolase
MVALRRRLAAAGHSVLTFDYPYIEAGRKAPDRAVKLLACHEAAARRLVAETGGPIVLAGKSMGGRIGSHLAADGYPCRALVFLGYPLVAVGSNTPRSVEHLREIASPMLFITGSRDRLAPLDILRPVVAGLRRADLEVVAEGDHSFRVPKRSGLDPEAVLDGVAKVTVDWLGRI